MIFPVNHVELQEPIAQDALRKANDAGKSLDEWVNDVLEQRFRLEHSAEAFFQARANGSTREGLRCALDRAPDVPPMPGDELNS